MSDFRGDFTQLVPELWQKKDCIFYRSMKLFASAFISPSWEDISHALSTVVFLPVEIEITFRLKLGTIAVKQLTFLEISQLK